MTSDVTNEVEEKRGFKRTRERGKEGETRRRKRRRQRNRREILDIEDERRCEKEEMRDNLSLHRQR